MNTIRVSYSYDFWIRAPPALLGAFFRHQTTKGAGEIRIAGAWARSRNDNRWGHCVLPCTMLLAFSFETQRNFLFVFHCTAICQHRPNDRTVLLAFPKGSNPFPKGSRVLTELVINLNWPRTTLKYGSRAWCWLAGSGCLCPGFVFS